MEYRGAEARDKIANDYGGIEGLCKSLKTSVVDGLPSDEQVLQRRRAVFGSNEIPPHPPKSLLRLIWEALQVSFRSCSTFYINLIKCFLFGKSITTLLLITSKIEEESFAHLRRIFNTFFFFAGHDLSDSSCLFHIFTSAPFPKSTICR